MGSFFGSPAASAGGLCTLSDTNAAGLGRYYWLLVDLPDVQNFLESSATAALGMMVDRHNDADFVVLDVRTGGRSGVTYGIMRSLGFHEVYNLLGGFEAFQAVPGAGAWLVGP